MSPYQHALSLARAGFHVFPLAAGEKTPAISGFKEVATRDPDAIRALFTRPMFGIDICQGFGVGIYCGRFGDDPAESLCVIDVDNKNGKSGSAELNALAAPLGLNPQTYMQATPTGGFHVVYRTRTPVGNGVGSAGERSRWPPGLDIRGTGGYIVAAGTTLPGKGTYTGNALPVAEASPALIERCSKYVPPRPKDLSGDTAEGIDPARADANAIAYLQHQAPLAVQNAAGDKTSFAVACCVRDFGVSEARTLELMMEHWNPRCTPPWDESGLALKVANAFQYARGAIGNADPSRMFTPVGTVAERAALPVPTQAPADALSQALLTPVDPVAEFNKRFAFVVDGGTHHLVEETRDEKTGQRVITPYNEKTFDLTYTGESIDIKRAKKVKNKDTGELEWIEEYHTVPLTKYWLHLPGSPRDPGDGKHWRRSYKQGYGFAPNGEPPTHKLNTWRGFCYDAPTIIVKSPWVSALDTWNWHVDYNFSHGVVAHSNWLKGWYAQTIQQPQTKMGTYVVLRGDQGVGKSTFVSTMRAIFGVHAGVGNDKRLFAGQFNAHLEQLILAVIEEGFWAGDNDAHNRLKNLVTDDEIMIEGKGKEMYAAASYVRFTMCTNEQWAARVPVDDRRCAVFYCLQANGHDPLAYARMLAAFNKDSEGTAYLLNYLRNYDISGLDLRRPPDTQARAEQKELSLPPAQRFIRFCLDARTIPWGGLSFAQGTWPTRIPKADLRAAFNQYKDEHGIKTQVSEQEFGRQIKQVLPEIEDGRTTVGGRDVTSYKLPTIEQGRLGYERLIKGRVKWSDQE